MGEGYKKLRAKQHSVIPPFCSACAYAPSLEISCLVLAFQVQHVEGVQVSSCLPPDLHITHQ